MSSQVSNPAHGGRIFRRILAIVSGVIVGCVLAIIAASVIMSVAALRVMTSTNGWVTTMQAGKPGNSIPLKAAMASMLPAVNVAQEAVYWTATKDGAKQTLNGAHDYVFHFPAGGLPPVDAFWSLSMTDANNHMVSNSINRYSVGDRTGLVKNADGSIDIYLQNTAPAGHETNWLPAPTGNFKLWLRAYQPKQAILNGSYKVPAVTEVK